ncbi:MAG TPA: hypothetical protein VGI78_00920 [Acetobacteraceae bacterium]|jgi:hypothetical protein
MAHICVHCQRIADRKAVVTALERLDERAIGEHDLPEIVASVSAIRGDRTPVSWKDPEAAMRSVALAKALYAARRISRQEYVFFASQPVEGIREARWLDGVCDADLLGINQAMESIKQNHGLRPEEDWAVGQGLVDYVRLNEEYTGVLRTASNRTLREFGLDDLADLNEGDPDTFDRLRERGRRAVLPQG